MTGENEMKSSAAFEEESFIDIDKYRRLVRNFLDMRRYQTALFWAEKVSILSQNDPKDIYWQAQCMFLLKEYHRAAYIIKFHGLEKTNFPCYYLAVESLLEAKEYNEANEILNYVSIEEMANSLIMNQSSDAETYNMWIDEQNKNEMLASACYLKGKLYEAMDNRALAMDCYVQALQKSIFCTEALDALVQHEMLMAWEEKELMQHLPFSQQCSESDGKFVKKLYESKLKKYYDSLSPHSNTEQTPIGNLKTLQPIKDLMEKVRKNNVNNVKINKNITNKISTPPTTTILSPANKILQELKNSPAYSLQSSLSKVSMTSSINDNTWNNEISGKDRPTASDCQTAIVLSSCLTRINQSADLMAAEAEKLFYDCEYKKCMKILDDLLKKDPYHNKGLTIKIGCLVEMKDFNKLFYLAHKLVDLYPDKAISWYAVGCYYDLIGKSDPARRFLSKATTLDRLYGPAWLAYGHSFAKENEHDQAMAAYFKATQLMRGCHLPLLYIGVECGLTKNLELAEKFFYQAMSIAPLDVFVLHELGVIKYEYEYYDSAEEVFKTTAEIVTNRAKQNQEAISPRWEPLFNNLGHCCRKNKKYQEALEYHQLALLLKPQKAETYTAIGFINALMGNLEEAIELFHKSLSLNRDCVVTSTILKLCIHDLLDDDTILENLCIKGNHLDTKNVGGGDATKTASPLSPPKFSVPTLPPGISMKLKFDDCEESDATVDNSCEMSIDN